MWRLEARQFPHGFTARFTWQLSKKVPAHKIPSTMQANHGKDFIYLITFSFRHWIQRSYIFVLSLSVQIPYPWECLLCQIPHFAGMSDGQMPCGGDVLALNWSAHNFWQWDKCLLNTEGGWGHFSNNAINYCIFLTYCPPMEARVIIIPFFFLSGMCQTISGADWETSIFWTLGG